MKNFFVVFFLLNILSCKSKSENSIALSACINLDDKSSDALFKSGLCFYEQKMYTESHEYLLKALENGKNDYEIWFTLGLVSFELNDFKEAQTDFMMAEKFESNDDVRYNIAINATRNKAYEVVIFYLKPLMSKVNDDYYCEYQGLFVEALIESGEIEEAEHSLMKSKCVDDVNKYLSFYIKEKKSDYKSIINENPVFLTENYNHKFFALKGYSYLMLNMYEEAIKQSIKSKDNTTSLYVLGHSYNKLNKKDSACIYLEQYLKFTTDSIEINEIRSICN